MNKPKSLRGTLLAVCVCLMSMAHVGAAAKELRIGSQVEPTSIDPHFATVDTNSAIAHHFFTPLVLRDEQLRPQPGLAESWENVDPLTWEFKLRKGVKFHDGSDFTAEDVAFTLERAGNVPNSPSSFRIYLREIDQVEVVDSHTIRIRTKEPFPLLPIYMGTFVVVSKAAAENATTADFESGKALVGTGPFKFVEWRRGDRLVMERFDGYWGEAPEWSRVTFRTIPSAPARVAALLSGDVDVIDFVPTADLATLEKNPGVSLQQGVTIRLIYLTVDQDRADSPHVRQANGQPFEGKGPLQDPRVREAMSMAINRKAISQRIMDGASAPTLQFMPEGFFGFVSDIPADHYDPKRARELLAEAGYKDGFRLNIHVPAQRYVNDVATMEAIAQMFTAIGIRTTVDTVPVSNFFSRANTLEFSVFMIGFGVLTGEPSSVMTATVATHDSKAGMGVGNRGRYSNSEVDRLLATAKATINDDEREQLLQEATRIAMKEQAMIPLHHQIHTWAVREGLTITPRTDEYTFAQNVSSSAK